MRRETMTEEDYSHLARAFRKVEFFAPLTVGQIEMILPYILLLRYDAGETVFRQGEAGDAFYIVHRGRVRVSRKTGFFSFSRRVAELGGGEFFGEMALLSKDPRSATVVCLEETRLFALTSADFGFVLKKNPAFKEEMDRVAGRRRFQTEHHA